MDNIKDDSYYIKKIITDMDFILTHTKELTSSFLERTKHLPWRQLNGIRNRIVHAYDVIRVDIVYDTVVNDLPQFKHELENMI